MSESALLAGEACTSYAVSAYLLLIIERRPCTDGITCIEKRRMFSMEDGVQ